MDKSTTNNPLHRRRSIPAPVDLSKWERDVNLEACKRLKNLKPSDIPSWNYWWKSKLPRIEALDIEVKVEGVSFGDGKNSSEFKLADFRRLSFETPSLSYCSFINCDFSNTLFAQSSRHLATTFSRCSFIESKWDNQEWIMFKDERSNWSKTKWSKCVFNHGMHFEGSSFVNSNWESVHIFSGGMSFATFSNNMWQDVQWENSDWKSSKLFDLKALQCILNNTHLSGVDLIDLNWNGNWEDVYLRKTKLDGEFRGKWKNVQPDLSTDISWLNHYPK